MRRVVLILAGLFAAGAAVGDEVKPANRFAVQPSDDGFIRLDTQTGAVSHCGRRDGVWFCEKLVEDRSALEEKIDALSARVDALSRAVDTLARAPAAGPPPRPANAGFATRLIDRLYALVRRITGGSAGS